LHHRRTDRLLSLSEDLPVVSVAVDRRDRIGAMLPRVLELQRRGMIALAFMAIARRTATASCRCAGTCRW
jgi:PII-like signaling protein